MGDENNSQISILIVEDYTLVRDGVVTLLNSDEKLKVIGEADTAEYGIEQMKRLKPDIILMDLGLPRMNGIEATKIIKDYDKNIKVIILTSHENEEEVVAALSAGANAYCLKDIDSERLLEVVKSVYDGAAWLDPTIAQVALDLFMKHDFTEQPTPAQINQELAAPLAGREIEVLRLLVTGMNNNQIAQELFVSVHTVKAHVTHILQKLSVHDRVTAAVKAVQEGLV